MAKNIEEDIPNSSEELAELDAIAEGSIPNKSEIVSLTSKMLGRTVNITRLQVYKYASVMSSNTQIADVLGIDKNTLLAHFKREITMGRAFARQKLLTRFYHLALYGNMPADRLFALKNWAGMSDTGMTDGVDDIDEGVEFVVRRPAKPIQKLEETEPTLETVAGPDEEA